MKILQVIPFFSPKFGGSVTVPYELSKELAKRNHQVTIITTDFGFDTQYADVIRSRGVEVIPFACIAHFGLFLYSPSIKKWLETNLKKFDIIHMHNYRSYQNNCVSYYATKNKIPYIVQAHGSVLPFFEKTGLKKLYDKIWGETVLRNAAKVIAVTSTEAQQYQIMGVPERKIEIIPLGISVAEYESLPQRGIFRKTFGITENEKIILFLGRIHKIKGVDLLVSAYCSLLDKNPDVRLVIAGPDSGFKPEIDRQIKKLQPNIPPLFTGPLYGQDKVSAYTDADIYVLPSRYETFPNTVLEAWACGTPVIATTGCQIADVIRNAGIVVDYDEEQLKKAIITLLRNDGLAGKTGKQGRDLVFTKFDQEIVITKILENYQYCINRK
jgi:glycosyltransferase involved in cell wall biosynthesis